MSWSLTKIYKIFHVWMKQVELLGTVTSEQGKSGSWAEGTGTEYNSSSQVEVCRHDQMFFAIMGNEHGSIYQTYFFNLQCHTLNIPGSNSNVFQVLKLK